MPIPSSFLKKRSLFVMHRLALMRSSNFCSGASTRDVEKKIANRMTEVYTSRYSELGEDNIPMTSGEKLASKHIEENKTLHNMTDSKVKFITSYSEFGDIKVTGHTLGYGVFREKEAEDIAVLVNNFTSPALARALREREEILQSCAALCTEKDYSKMEFLLAPFLKVNVDKRRQKQRRIDLTDSFHRKDLVILQRYLHRMPRQVFQAARDRASVLIPLCNDKGKASILFQRRSVRLRRFKYDICFPGGMVDENEGNKILLIFLI